MKEEELLKRLDILGKMLYERCGTDSYAARCYLHDTKEIIKEKTKCINCNSVDFDLKDAVTFQCNNCGTDF